MSKIYSTVMIVGVQMKLNRIFTSLVLVCCFIASGCYLDPPKPRLQLDSPKIRKTDVFHEHITCTVKAIQKGDFHPTPGDEVAVLGQRCVWLLSATSYKVLSIHERCEELCLGLSPWLVDIDGDGIFEIMIGGGGFGDVGVLDTDGNELWIFHPHETLAPNKMISSDINGNGIPEFYVADRTGLYRLDADGQPVWSITESHFYDVGTANNIILGLAEGKEIISVDFDGNIIGRFDLEEEKYNFDVVKWPEKESILMGYFKRRVYIRDLNGDMVFEHPLNDFPLYHAPQGIAVRFDENAPPYLVILAHSRSSLCLTQLSIFNPSGSLAYQEILRSTTGICVNIDTETQNEVLLIGNGTNGVLKYDYSSGTGMSPLRDVDTL